MVVVVVVAVAVIVVGFCSSEGKAFPLLVGEPKFTTAPILLPFSSSSDTT